VPSLYGTFESIACSSILNCQYWSLKWRIKPRRQCIYEQKRLKTPQTCTASCKQTTEYNKFGQNMLQNVLYFNRQHFQWFSPHTPPSSDTQGWFRSLHQPLGQLPVVEFPSMYHSMNTIISLVASSFSDEQDDQWKQSLQESGYLIGPHAITLRIDFRWQIQSFSS